MQEFETVSTGAGSAAHFRLHTLWQGPLNAILLLAVVVVLAGTHAVAEESEPGLAILQAVQQQQADGDEQRKRWNFDQQVLVRMMRGNGKLAREELRQYRVRPTAKEQQRDLTSLQGKVAIKREIYPYSDPEYRTGDIDLDGELTQGFAEEMLFGKKSGDGIPDSMYPLSEKMMQRHQFTYHGEENYQSRTVHRFTFEPKRKSDGGEQGMWEGEVLVDRDALAPVLLITHQARKVPVAVRTLLGSNVKQIGFKLEYTEMPDGTWFPVRYSGEFSLRVLFGYSRRIAMSVRNENFERASADTEIRYHLEPDAEAQLDQRSDEPASESNTSP